jgi:site-specific DNA-methyltransferase (adenine-specific)
MTTFATMKDTKDIKTLADLTPDGENFNRHTEFGQKLLEDSLRKFGAGRSILVDKDGNIIAGNSTTETAAAIGMEDVIVVPTDGKKLVVVQRTDLSLDSPEGRELALADNMTALKGIDLDLAKVQETLGDDLAKAWGMEIPEVQNQAQEDDFDPDKPVETVCKKGDIWKLGNHRLMCGDSTDAGSVALLMDGEKADITFTSPPYNAGFGKCITKDNGRSKYTNGSDDDLPQSEYREFLQKSINNALDSSEFSFSNIQMLANNKTAFVDILHDNVKNLADIIVWDKQRAQPQLAERVLNSVVEFVLCFSGKGTRAIGVKKFHGTLENIIHIPPKRNEFSAEHNAVFPIDLPTHFINNFSEKSVLDLFGGSGTTLIAAEQLNRKCYMMELDPHYCDVIIARWEKLTNQKAERITT